MIFNQKPRSPIDDCADAALHEVNKGRADLALPFIAELVRSDDWRADFIQGAMYERGGYRVPIDLELAVDHFQRSLVRHPASLTMLFLARVLTELGRRDEALARIHEAIAFDDPPEAQLAMANFFDCAPQRDLRRIRHHYWRAALRGRIAGLEELARLRAEQGQRVLCLALKLLRSVALPAYLLAQGAQARRSI